MSRLNFKAALLSHMSNSPPSETDNHTSEADTSEADTSGADTSTKCAPTNPSTIATVQAHGDSPSVNRQGARRWINTKYHMYIPDGQETVHVNVLDKKLTLLNEAGMAKYAECRAMPGTRVVNVRRQYSRRNANTANDKHMMQTNMTIVAEMEITYNGVPATIPFTTDTVLMYSVRERWAVTVTDMKYTW